MTIKQLREKSAAIRERVAAAIKDGDVEGLEREFSAFAENIQEQFLAEAREAELNRDSAVLAQRGVRQLTGEERAYYQAITEAMRSNNPKQALSDVNLVLPKTTIDAVFDDLQSQYPLFSVINFQNTGALVEIILATSGGVAFWGELTAEIVAELSAGFSVLDLTLKKLSGLMLVSNAYLDLGPEWLDRLVRTVLTEAIATGLEDGIVDGDGNLKPLGMTRMLTGDTGGVYPRKTPIEVTSLDPVSVGKILEIISQGPNNKRRVIPNLLMVVNPADYYTKVYPATTVRAADGTFNNNITPYPMTIIPAASVPEGFAVFGLAARYFFGLGNSRGGKLEHSDEYKFLEDIRAYRIKLYGNGRALDENAFVYADITNLQPAVLQVEIIEGNIPEG